MASDYIGSYTGIAKGEQISAADMTAALNKMEKVANKKDVVNNSSEEFPSSKAVYELVCPGIIYPYAGATAPTGWAFCDGQAVSRTAYPKLFEAIGTTWGTGNGSTTFNIPDLRGAHIRGVGNSAATGFARENVYVSLAERIDDAIRNITGAFYAMPGTVYAYDPTGALYTILRGGGVDGKGSTSGSFHNGFDASRVVPTANENRVKARGVNFIIKLV